MASRGASKMRVVPFHVSRAALFERSLGLDGNQFHAGRISAGFGEADLWIAPWWVFESLARARCMTEQGIGKGSADMEAVGTKRTSSDFRSLVASGRKADIAVASAEGCF